MLALGHLHANALLVVLAFAALAIALLRAAVHFSQRALVARDRAIIDSIERTFHDPNRQERHEQQR